MATFTQLAIVFLGGGLGSICRYLGSLWLNRPFPWATLWVNGLGSFIIGLVYGLILSKSGNHEAIKLLFITGFCGGFTTFSAFSYENFSFLLAGEWMKFGSYVVASLVIGLLAVWLGYRLTH